METFDQAIKGKKNRLKGHNNEPIIRITKCLENDGRNRNAFGKMIYKNVHLSVLELFCLIHLLTHPTVQRTIEEPENLFPENNYHERH